MVVITSAKMLVILNAVKDPRILLEAQKCTRNANQL